ncbi:hypothetical protein COE58_24340 [Bacillus cereus]|nr:hypothetical protein COE58_24340 [Bacillus cereus]
MEITLTNFYIQGVLSYIQVVKINSYPYYEKAILFVEITEGMFFLRCIVYRLRHIILNSAFGSKN